ncbi:cytochrome P450 9e2-like [Periplaneta americana]|uniref:cytochrome P450 9e2-like n=1 Tax=Periplaneta americana TaxID=6978 RepID=UPI0037E93912
MAMNEQSRGQCELVIAMEWTLMLAAAVCLCLSLVYWYLTRNNNFFAKRGVPFLPPTLLVGNMGPLFARKTAVSDHVRDMYDHLDRHPVGGIFQFLQPMFMIRDPALVRLVTVKDFEHFVDLPILIPEDAEPILTKNLQALKGQKWKDMRSTLSPAFTSSKMRLLFSLVSEIGQQMTSYLDAMLQERQAAGEQTDDPTDILPLEMKDLSTKYTNDVIATSAFGIKCDTLANPNNDFYKMGKEFTKVTFLKFLIFTLYSLLPKVMKALGLRMIPKKVSDFFRSLVRNSIKVREKEGIVRPDMIHLLMQVRDNDLRDEPTETSALQTDKKMSLDIDDIAAQALVFFSAGFEVVAVLLSFASTLLAVHQDVQERAREEIDEILAKYDGQVTYEAIQSMKQVDNVLSETLRIYPPAPIISRKCVKKYQVPNSDIIFEPEDIVTIPLRGLQLDSQYFPDPDTFNPDRFSDEHKHNIQPFTYIPFGSGPRQCIANRFALMVTKTALVHLLHHFELHTCSKTKLPLQLAKSFTFSFEGGFWVGLKSRSHHHEAEV